MWNRSIFLLCHCWRSQLKIIFHWPTRQSRRGYKVSMDTKTCRRITFWNRSHRFRDPHFYIFYISNKVEIETELDWFGRPACGTGFARPAWKMNRPTGSIRFDPNALLAVKFMTINKTVLRVGGRSFEGPLNWSRRWHRITLVNQWQEDQMDPSES